MLFLVVVEARLLQLPVAMYSALPMANSQAFSINTSTDVNGFTCFVAAGDKKDACMHDVSLSDRPKSNWALYGVISSFVKACKGQMCILLDGCVSDSPRDGGLKVLII